MAKQTLEERRHKNAAYMRAYNKKNYKILRKKAKMYREANKERYQETNRAWREANKERVRQNRIRYRESNIDAIRAKQRDFYIKNKRKVIRQAKAYYEANKAVIRKTASEAHQKDPRRVMLNAAKVRARKKNIAFCLQKEDIVIPSHCPVLGMLLTVGNGHRLPNSPSLDRIDPKGPYSVANCRVISFKANTLKNDGTIEDHERIILYMKGLL